MVVVQLLSHIQLFGTPWQYARLPGPSLSPEVCSAHVHWVGDAIQPSHPLSPPSPALNLSQHQGLFQWAGCSHQVAKVLELQLHVLSFQWIFRVDFLEDWLVWPPCSLRESQESSSAPQFESITSLVLSFLYGPTLTSIHNYWKTIPGDCSHEIKRPLYNYF